MREHDEIDDLAEFEKLILDYGLQNVYDSVAQASRKTDIMLRKQFEYEEHYDIKFTNQNYSAVYDQEISESLMYSGEPIWHYGGRNIHMRVNNEVVCIINGEGKVVKEVSKPKTGQKVPVKAKENVP